MRDARIAFRADRQARGPVRRSAPERVEGPCTVTLLNGEKTRVPVLPIEMDGVRFGTRLDVPKAGEHTREVLESVGYTKGEIDTMIAADVVATA
jgi:crotonobetainyl-CoA:carnitine CoA-transferase CaiB-like acyl-CoA transferase